MKNRIFDYVLFFSATILSVFGLLAQYSYGTDNLVFYKQLGFIFFGILACLTIAYIDLSFLKKGYFVINFYLLSLFILFSTFVIGTTTNGAKSWIKIAGFSFQPAELVKLAVMLVLAKYFTKRHLEINNFYHIVVSFAYVAVPGLCILLQPDLGSAMVIFGIWGFVVLASGISKKHLVFLFTLAAGLSIFAWTFLFQAYQKDRILNFLDPVRDVRGSGYNVYQALIAVGSAGVTGKGFDAGSQSRLSYLPEYETDFVFAAFAEEWGMYGSLLLLLFMAILITKLVTQSLSTRDNFSTLFLVGFASYLFIHFTINVGMNIGLLPVTGIPLPFMSAGGTHLLLEWVMVGLALSFKRYGQPLKVGDLS